MSTKNNRIYQKNNDLLPQRSKGRRGWWCHITKNNSHCSQRSKGLPVSYYNGVNGVTRVSGGVMWVSGSAEWSGGGVKRDDITSAALACCLEENRYHIISAVAAFFV